MKNKYFVLVILVSLMGVISYAKAADLNLINFVIPGPTIKACVNPAGQMYLIGQGFTQSSCSGSYNQIYWNVAGPQGVQGPQGPQGLPGIAGAGSQFHLYDANNQDLGVLVRVGNRSTQDGGEGLGSTHEVFLPNLQLLVNILEVSPTEISSNPLNNVGMAMVTSPDTGFTNIYYSGPNCTGSTYAQNTPTNAGHFTLIANSPSNYFRSTGVVFSEDGILTQSYKTYNGNLLQCYNQTNNNNHVLGVNPVTLPFSIPLAYPLHIQ